jgi:hypothetical protein
MVGRRHQRQTGASQSASRGCQEIPDRISRECCSRRSSANDQQSLRPQESAAHNHQYALGALLSRGTTSQSSIHTGRVHHVRKELDCPAMGQSPTRASQNSRGRALASSDRSGRWNESQDQVCYVGFVFPRSSMGVLWPQSDLFRHTGGNWGQARPEHRRANQRQASEIPFSFVTRTTHVRAGGTRVSGSASRFSGRGLGNSPRRTRGAPLAGVRLRKHELQRSALVLLAPRWKPEEHKDGSVCKAVADASKPQTILAGVEVTKSLQPAGRLRFSIRKTARQQAPGSSFSVKEEDSACIQTNRNHGCWLAHFSALGWNHAGVLAGDFEDQTFSAGQIGRRDFANGYFAEDKPDPMNAAGERFRMGPFSSGAYRPLTSPDLLNVRVASA